MKSFYKLTISTFPLEAKKADKVYYDLGFEEEDEAYNIWFESFAEVTNELMKDFKTEAVHHHFSFFLLHLENGSDIIKKCIDVSYVENLFWGLDKEISDYYWALLPVEMQALYLDFHGFKAGENAKHP